MIFRIANKYTIYEVEAPDVEAAKAIAEKQHTHAAKRGWTWSWRERRDGLGWFLDIRNSKGTPMAPRGYGCSVFTTDPIERG